MVSPADIRTKLLLIHRSGTYATLDPAGLLHVHTQLTEVLAFHPPLAGTVELYDLYELLFYVSLLLSEDKVALRYLNLIVDKFGHNQSQRITLMKTAFLHATEGVAKASFYIGEKIKEDEDLLRLVRTAVGLLKLQKSVDEYIKALVSYLDRQPHDLQAWSELSEQYTRLGNYTKAIHCLKEVLMVEPYAYPVFTKVGEVSLVGLKQIAEAPTPTTPTNLDQAYTLANDGRKAFLRAIELCDNCAEAWVGLHVMTHASFPTNTTFTARGAALRSHKALEAAVVRYMADNEALHRMAAAQLVRLSADSDLPQTLLAAIAAVCG